MSHLRAIRTLSLSLTSNPASEGGKKSLEKQTVFTTQDTRRCAGYTSSSTSSSNRFNQPGNPIPPLPPRRSSKAGFRHGNNSNSSRPNRGTALLSLKRSNSCSSGSGDSSSSGSDEEECSFALGASPLPAVQSRSPESPTAPTIGGRGRAELTFEQELQRHLYAEYRAERHANWVLEMEIKQCSGPLTNWTRKQQAMSLAFLVGESYSYHKRQAAAQLKLKAASPFSKDNALLGRRPRGGAAASSSPSPSITIAPPTPKPPVSPPAVGAISVAHRPTAMKLLHDVFILIDHKKGPKLDRYQSVRVQLINLHMWRPQPQQQPL